MRRVYATRSMKFEDVESDYNKNGIQFDQMYLGRIFRACERNKVYFIGLEESGRTLESLRMLISKTASDMQITVKTAIVGDALSFYVVGEIKELIV